MSKVSLLQLPETVCACEKCVAICLKRPCWGLPSEIRKLFEAGYGFRLMQDYWARVVEPDISIISPAMVGYEGKRAPFWPDGRCTFLTEDNLCELHVPGLKPIEGRLAYHTDEKKAEPNIHKMVAMEWKSLEGQSVVNRWKEVVGKR